MFVPRGTLKRRTSSLKSLRSNQLNSDSQESISYINTKEFPDKSEKNDDYQYQKLRLSYYTGDMLVRYPIQPSDFHVIPRMESIITLIQKFYSESRINNMTCFANIYVKVDPVIYIEMANEIDYDRLEKEYRALGYLSDELAQKLSSKSELKKIYNSENNEIDPLYEDKTNEDLEGRVSSIYEELRQFVARSVPPIELISPDPILKNDKKIETDEKKNRYYFFRINLMRALIVPDPIHGNTKSVLDSEEYYDVLVPIVCKIGVRNTVPTENETVNRGQLAILKLRFNLLKLFQFNSELNKKLRGLINENEGDYDSLESLNFAEDFNWVSGVMLKKYSDSIPLGSLNEKLKYAYPAYPEDKYLKLIHIQGNTGNNYAHFFKYNTIADLNTNAIRPLTNRPSPDIIRERLEYIVLGLDSLKQHK